MFSVTSASALLGELAWQANPINKFAFLLFFAGRSYGVIYDPGFTPYCGFKCCCYLVTSIYLRSSQIIVSSDLSAQFSDEVHALFPQWLYILLGHHRNVTQYYPKFSPICFLIMFLDGFSDLVYYLFNFRSSLVSACKYSTPV